MNVSQADVQRAAEEVGLTREQSLALWNALNIASPGKASFQAVHVAYYFGALTIAGAMGWFVTEAFDKLVGLQLSLIGLVYAAIALGAAVYFLKRPDLRILGGICASVAVCMTPLIVFGVEKQFNVWPTGESGRYSDFHPYIRACWVYMEVGTVVAGLALLRWFHFPFITAPVAYALWYMSMDASALLLRSEWNFRQECYISIAFGAAMLVVSFFVDRNNVKDYAFWGYLFGMLTLWGGLSLLDSGNQAAKFAYACLNVGFVLISVWLGRKVFLIFGALGVFGYLASLAHTLFKDSMLFPFALSVIGIAIIALGVMLQKSVNAK